MAFTQNPIATRIKQPQCALANIANATGTGVVTLMTAGVNGSKVTGIQLTNTDGAAHAIQVAVSNGTVGFILTTANVAANAGNDGATPALSVLNNIISGGLPVDNDGNPYIFIPASNTITIKAATALNTGNLVYAICTYGDF